MSLTDQPRRKVARQMDTGTSLASAGVRATARPTSSLQLPARINSTVTRVKDNGLSISGRPRAKLIVQSEVTRAPSMSPRPGLRPTTTMVIPLKREDENLFNRSRSDLGQDRRATASRLSDKVAVDTRDLMVPFTPGGAIMASSVSSEFGPSCSKHGLDRTNETQDRAAAQTTTTDRSFEEWHERPKIPGSMSPRSSARTSARKARLLYGSEEQTHEALELCTPGLMRGASVELSGRDGCKLQRSDNSNAMDNVPDDVTIEPGGGPTAVDEAKKDRKYEDLLITNRSLLILNRQHEAEVSKKDRLIASLRRQLRASAHTEPGSHLVGGHAVHLLTDPLDHDDGDSDLTPDVDIFIECMHQLETSVLRSSDKLVHMANRGAQAVHSINDITNGVKSKVLGDKGGDDPENPALIVEQETNDNASS